MSYIDGCVIAVPTANRDRFIAHVRLADAAFRDAGALNVVDCWGDDVPTGTHTDFRRAVAAREDETIVFSWIEWPDKATRDAGMQKVMQDPRMSSDANPMPFDSQRMIYGGFQPLAVPR
jgi:uncharacterized protein YbaA (DUF1428 family)